MPPAFTFCSPPFPMVVSDAAPPLMFCVPLTCVFVVVAPLLTFCVPPTWTVVEFACPPALTA